MSTIQLMRTCYFYNSFVYVLKRALELSFSLCTLVGVTYVVDGEDDRASSAPGTCHDTDQLEYVMKKIHGCRNFGKTLIP